MKRSSQLTMASSRLANISLAAFSRVIGLSISFTTSGMGVVLLNQSSVVPPITIARYLVSDFAIVELLWLV